MPPNRAIVVVGAGVSGLTTALLLAREHRYRITVIAKHMPGDFDAEYASPWAGANYLPFSTLDSLEGRLERETWNELSRLAQACPESGVHFQETFIYRRVKDVGTAIGDWSAELTREDAWFKDVVPNFRTLPKAKLPPGMDGATAFTSICISTPLYLSWLVSECIRNGVVLRRGAISHISDAARLHASAKRADLIVNCTGLASLRLGGVEDKTLYPGRGQVVIVRNDPGITAGVSGTDDGSDEACYVMSRPAGGGCVLGGCLQANDWDIQPDPNLAVRIMQRAVALVPSLVPHGKGIEALSIVRHGVGIRPMRTGGMRVDLETTGEIPVVHNYGHGGYGYQTSYGAAAAAVRLVEDGLPLKASL